MWRERVERMSYLLLNGIVTHRSDSAVADSRLRNLREELRMQKDMRDRAVAKIAAIKAELAEIKALDATLDTSDIP